MLAVFQVAAYLFSEGAEVDEASRLAPMESNLNTYQNLSSLDFDELLFFVSWDPEAGAAKTFDVFTKPRLDLAKRNGMSAMISFEPSRKKPSGQQVNYSLDSIISGEHDQYLSEYFEKLAAYTAENPEVQISIRTMHAMNAPIDAYHWSNSNPGKYKKAYAHIYEIGSLCKTLKWSFVFNNFSADSNWRNKRADSYLKWMPGSIEFESIGVAGFSRPYLKSKDGPTGGEVTPGDVLPEQFFQKIRERLPHAKLVVSETGVPYMKNTSELIEYTDHYYMKDQERAYWYQDLFRHLSEMDSKYNLNAVTISFGGNDHARSIDDTRDILTVVELSKTLEHFQRKGIRVGMYLGK